MLETSNPLLLKFSNMEDKDKYRLRLIYNAMSAVICGQEIPNEITKKLTDKDLEIKKWGIKNEWRNKNNNRK